MKTKAIFLDRDGVIVRDNGPLSSVNNIEILEDVAGALDILRLNGFKIIMVSNQSVVSRGIISFDEMVTINNKILDLIKDENPNAFFDDVYFSPFHPSATVMAYRQDSECRKPRSGMLLSAQKKFNIDFQRSFIIGDRLSDVYAGNHVGCTSILLKTGAESEPFIETSLVLEEKFLIPDFVFWNLKEAALFICQKATRKMPNE